MMIIFGESSAAFGYFGVWFLHRLALGQSPFLAALAIIAGQSILEFFWSMSDLALPTVIAAETTESDRGLTVGILEFSGSLGILLGVAVSGAFYSFQYPGGGFAEGITFFFISGLLFLGVIVVSITVPKTSNHFRGDSDNPELNGSTDLPVPKLPRTLILFFGTLILVILGSNAINQIILFFFEESPISATPLEISLILSVGVLSGMIASPLLGRLSDRFGRFPAVFLAMVLLISPQFFLGFSTAVIHVILFNILIGAGQIGLQSTAYALTADLAPTAIRGRVFAIYNAIRAVGWGAAGFFIGGPITDIQMYGIGIAPRIAYTNVFVISAFIGLIGIIGLLIFVAPRLKRKSNSHESQISQLP